MRWKDKNEPVIPQLTTRLPRLAELLKDSPDNLECFWFILEEDKFDTLLGDNLAQYFQGTVFASEDAARAYAEPLNEDTRKRESETGELGVSYIVKSFQARLDGKVILPIGHEPEPSQDYYIEKILTRIEETLASDGKLPWGTRFPGW